MPLKGVRLNEPLRKHTTFRIGGPADLFFVAKKREELKKAVNSARKFSLPFFILGGGSNLLVSDKGFRGLVIKNQTSKISLTKGLVEADSGVRTSQLVKLTIDQGLFGLENFFGLPGTIGGAVYGEAHFKGKKINEFVSKIEKSDGVILSVVFKLKPGNKRELWQRAKEALRYRRMTQPIALPSAGCIFKNPPSQSAGSLLEECGLKGTRIGGAMVSPKHANFIVNTGKARAQDVLGLIKLCQKKVKEKFGIKLEEEIIKVGDFDG